jgi:AAHS family 4-hydroxybenzoate transporter-like MFS transporter
VSRCSARGSLLTALVLATQSMTLLTVVRLVTGIALGVVLPTAVSFAASRFPAERRQRVSATVTLGLACGISVVGLFGGSVLRSIGPVGILVVGGVFPLLLAAVLAALLPATSTADGPSRSIAAYEAGVGRILQPRLRVVTLTLWVFAFLVFLVSYTLNSWVPTLLTEYGFAAADAPIGLAYMAIGGVLGGLVLIALIGRVGAAAALVVMSSVAIVGLVVSGAAGLGGLGMLFAIGVAGAGVVGTQVGQLSLAVAIYPDGARTTGVGWAAAWGRVGSVVGPAAVGLLLAMAVPASKIILWQVVPVVVAATCAGVLWRRTRTGSAEVSTRAVEPSR